MFTGERLIAPAGLVQLADMKDWLRLAFTWSVVKRALTCAILVGTVLISINHGDAILAGSVTSGRLLRMGLTLLVPYCVSTYSSVAAMRADGREKRGSKESET